MPSSEIFVMVLQNKSCWNDSGDCANKQNSEENKSSPSKKSSSSIHSADDISTPPQSPTLNADKNQNSPDSMALCSNLQERKKIHFDAANLLKESGSCKVLRRNSLDIIKGNHKTWENSRRIQRLSLSNISQYTLENEKNVENSRLSLPNINQNSPFLNNESKASIRSLPTNYSRSFELEKEIEDKQNSSNHNSLNSLDYEKEVDHHSLFLKNDCYDNIDHEEIIQDHRLSLSNNPQSSPEIKKEIEDDSIGRQRSPPKSDDLLRKNNRRVTFKDIEHDYREDNLNSLLDPLHDKKRPPLREIGFPQNPNASSRNLSQLLKQKSLNLITNRSNDIDESIRTSMRSCVHEVAQLSKERRSRLTPLREKVGELLRRESTEIFIIVCILINSVMMGIATFDFVSKDEEMNEIFEICDGIFLLIFTIESGMNLFYEGSNTIHNPWLLFDLMIVLSSWLITGEVAVVRAFRVFRAIRLVSRMQGMRHLVEAFGKSMSRMIGICALLGFEIYIFSVYATETFRELPYNELSHNYFATLQDSLLTAIQFLCADNWTSITREVVVHRYAAWVPFTIFVIISYFILVSLFIAVINFIIGELHKREMKKRYEKYSRMTSMLVESDMGTDGDSETSSNGKKGLSSYDNESDGSKTIYAIDMPFHGLTLVEHELNELLRTSQEMSLVVEQLKATVEIGIASKRKAREKDGFVENIVVENPNTRASQSDFNFNLSTSRRTLKRMRKTFKKSKKNSLEMSFRPQLSRGSSFQMKWTET